MKNTKSKNGVALVGVIAFTVIFTILAFSLLSIAKSEIDLAAREINRSKAFYLAEAGITAITDKMRNRQFEDIDETTFEDGSYSVAIYESTPDYVISTGVFAGQVKQIRADFAFLAKPYEDAVYAGNLSGTNFVFDLRGQGDPRLLSGREIDGRDTVSGNVFIDGNIKLYEDSAILPAPIPNTYQANGDVEATGSINLLDSASVSGQVSPNSDSIEPPDLMAMNYPVNNTHNISRIFEDSDIDSGRLPSDHELRNVITKNPSDRLQECATTVGDDYFFEPSSGFVTGATQKSASTRLDLGNDRIYYVDGNVWIHNPQTYGFLASGKVTIVATGDIHICDNVKYADNNSMIGLVAMGNYDNDGDLVSGGNIYFGDPRFGTTYTVSAVMFAANDFLYNTDSVTGAAEEPLTGFSVFGNFSALNKINVYRDWYTNFTTWQSHPAYFDSQLGKWVDAGTGIALTTGQLNSLRHYQLQIKYDDRLRSPDERPPSLPRGGRSIFAGLTNWQEL